LSDTSPHNSSHSDSDPIESLYNEVLVYHVKEPRGTLPIPKANADALSRNESCGDEVSVRLLIENGTVAEAELQAEGCMICRASASLCAQAIQGQPVSEVRQRVDRVRALIQGGSSEPNIDWSQLTPSDPEAYHCLVALQDFPTRQPCALMAWETVARALDAYGGNFSDNLA
jgi:nitrogen fixation NifU-like protein